MAEHADRKPASESILSWHSLMFVFAMVLLMSGVGYAVLRWLQGTA